MRTTFKMAARAGWVRALNRFHLKSVYILAGKTAGFLFRSLCSPPSVWSLYPVFLPGSLPRCRCGAPRSPESLFGFDFCENPRDCVAPSFRAILRMPPIEFLLFTWCSSIRVPLVAESERIFGVTARQMRIGASVYIASVLSRSLRLF